MDFCILVIIFRGESETEFVPSWMNTILKWSQNENNVFWEKHFGGIFNLI